MEHPDGSMQSCDGSVKAPACASAATVFALALMQLALGHAAASHVEDVGEVRALVLPIHPPESPSSAMLLNLHVLGQRSCLRSP